jgi:putative spermidine/putrescine transport system ATP-binding protein
VAARPGLATTLTGAVLAEATPAIELRHATKRYGETVALNDVSMVIEPGEFFCLLGPSGCGKTTTLNLIGGFIPLTSGELLVEGRTVSDLPPHKRNVNTVFQNYALFPHMSVAKNIAFGLRMERLSSAEITSRTAEYLELVALERYGSRMPSELSGGQQQRVALARALAKRPAVLLLDEPLGALDLKLRKQMQTELSRIHRQVGTTFVFVTHDQEEALSMADRVGVMRAGQLEQCAQPSELYDRPATPFVAEFVGTMNRLTATMVADGKVSVGSQTLPADGESPPSGTKVTVLVRPEAVVVKPDPSGETVVDTATFRGATIRLILRRDDDSTVLADVPSHRAAELAPGTRTTTSLLERPVLLATG